MFQSTIQDSIQFTGIGLHTGEKITCVLHPAPANTGIVFRVDNEHGKATIIPSPKAVTSTDLATTLSNKKVSVSTVEHLLAALRGLQVDNVYIDINSIEVPILDGSAAPFVKKILATGIKRLTPLRKFLRVSSPITYGTKEKFVRIEPYDGFLINCIIDFPHPAIGRQEKTVHVTPETFTQIADARTFCLLAHVEHMQSQGLALGGSLDNAIVIDKDVINREGLRHKDEFVRHKLLDFIGDMAVFPVPLRGKFTVYCSGHALNNEFARHLASSSTLHMGTMDTPSIARPIHGFSSVASCLVG